ncbi:hypothetical protein LguiA_036102 [Lonicera macranthoides]
MANCNILFFITERGSVDNLPLMVGVNLSARSKLKQREVVKLTPSSTSSWLDMKVLLRNVSHEWICK